MACSNWWKEKGCDRRTKEGRPERKRGSPISFRRTIADRVLFSTDVRLCSCRRHATLLPCNPGRPGASRSVGHETMYNFIAGLPYVIPPDLIEPTVQFEEKPPSLGFKLNICST